MSISVRPAAKGWHGVTNATPEQHDASFLPPPGDFLEILYCCFFFATRRGSPDISVELNLGLVDVPVSSIFSCTHIIHLIVIT